MEIQKRLSTCWQRFTACFKKPNQPGDESRTENPPVVIKNPGAKSEPDAPSAPVPSSTVRPGVYYIAQYDYSARTVDDLSFNAGDKLEALDKSAGEWWFARALTGISVSKQGYIPANYVAPVESIDSEP